MTGVTCIFAAPQVAKMQVPPVFLKTPTDESPIFQISTIPKLKSGALKNPIDVFSAPQRARMAPAVSPRRGEG